MKSIHWCFWALRPVVSSYLLLLRLLTPITVLRSSTIVAQTWTLRFTIALSSDSFLPAERSCRLRGLSPQHRGRINNRELSLWIEGPGSIAHMGTDRSSDGWFIDTGGRGAFPRRALCQNYIRYCCSFPGVSARRRSSSFRTRLSPKMQFSNWVDSRSKSAASRAYSKRLKAATME